MESFAKRALCATGLAFAGISAVQAILRTSRFITLDGRTAIVTGGSRGLGLVLARELVASGARVAICARTSEDLMRAEHDLRERGGDVLAIQCDVRDAQQVQQFVDSVLDRWSTIDVLINNAGVIEVGPIDAMTGDDFRNAMDTHCWGPLNTINAVLPTMRSAHFGRIVNIASIGGKVAVPHLIPYVASKFALVGLSNALRTELAQDRILVTTINPGLMRTGSPRNATFKGQHRKEYAWFSIGDSLSITSMSAENAARKIVRACQYGDPELTLSMSAKFGALMSQVMPDLTLEVLSLVNRLLPAMGGIGQQAAKGSESQSNWSPSWLTQLSEQAAVKNNEV